MNNNNILFYKPSNHLTFYFISRLIFENNNNNQLIYVILENIQFKKISDTWKEYIDKYDLNHFYFYGSKNLVLINENDFNSKDIKNNILKDIKTIYYILNENVDLILTENNNNNNKSLFINEVLKKYKKINIICGVPSIYCTQNTDINKYYLDNIYPILISKAHKNNKIFYYSLYLGESKRGILNDNSINKSFFNLIKEFYLFKKYNDEFDFLYLDDLESIYLLFKDYFINNLLINKNKKKKNKNKQEYIFNNHGSYKFYEKEFTNDLLSNQLFMSSYGASLISNFKNYQQKYHDTLYLLHKNKNIIKIDYKTNIDVYPFLLKHDYYSSDKLLSNKPLNLLSGLIAFISLNVIFIIILLTLVYIIYFRNKFLNYQKYIILTILIIFFKIPSIFNKIGSLLKESLSSVFEYFSGNIIYDNNTIDNNKKYIFTWNPHHIIPLGSFLSILSNQFKEKYSKNIINVCHEFLIYFPFSSIVLDFLGFKACTKNNIENELIKNNSVGLWIGGRTEMFKIEENRDILYITKRRGIFELAIKYQTSLIPTFTFGDNNTYLTEIFEDDLYILKHKFVFPTFRSVYKEFIKFIQIFRKKPEYLTVIGEPIEPPFYDINSNESISDELIEEYKNKYIKSLLYLYEKYKNYRYNINKKLVIL